MHLQSCKQYQFAQSYCYIDNISHFTESLQVLSLHDNPEKGYFIKRKNKLF